MAYFMFSVFGLKTEPSAELKRQIYFSVQGYRLSVIHSVIIK